MNCNEIVYDRKITGSFMILKCDRVRELDEKILLKTNIKGIVCFEKCFVDGKTQFWYNISGIQSLELLCQFNDIRLDFLEKLIVEICNIYEQLEKHLIDTRCLVLQPELIFVSNQDDEIYFTVYPGEDVESYKSFQQLMEYMLTKLDHSDSDAVHIAYGIYEKLLSGNYSISDVRNAIISARQEKTKDKIEDRVKEIDLPSKLYEDDCEDECCMQENTDGIKRIKYYFEDIKNKISSSIKQKNRKKAKEDIQFEIYPNETIEETVPEIHPTVCLSDFRDHPQGMLLYEGRENIGNITIKKNMVKIGQGEDVDEVIDKDTVSHFHAVIKKENNEYYLEDLNSTNGTFVNEELLTYRQKRQLKINDIVRFADVKYRFV